MEENPKLTKIAIFASGAGTNAQKIIHYFRNHPFIRVSLVVCNKKEAGVLHIAEQEQIPYIIVEKEKFFRGDAYLPDLAREGIDFIVLAGFLWKIPPALVNKYPGKIVNIHPALLPKYGGKGMYGTHVHEAVIDAREKESGITIHYVDELYDNGRVLFQAKCRVEEGETPESLAAKIHLLEHRYYPEIIEKLVDSQIIVKR